MLVLDSGGLRRLAQRSRSAAAFIGALRREGLWPPVVPTVVIAESTSGRPRTDAAISRFLKACDVDASLSPSTARRAGELRALARTGTVVDAIVVSIAEPGGTVLTSDAKDVRVLAARADDVSVEVV